ncbi:hypothetical protein CJJ09_002014 [Candidozyma auris]|nr:hypothetical protein CJJ09_002014 [[Candida] auris]
MVGDWFIRGFHVNACSLSLPDGVIPISNGDLSAISEAHREHYTLIALTSTDPKHDCESCRDLEAMLSTVAKAWFADHTFSNYLFFAKIDIADRSNKPVFDYLQLKSVPQVWLVPPSAVVEIHSKKKRPVDEDGQPIFGKYDMLLEPHAEFEIPMSISTLRRSSLRIGLLMLYRNAYTSGKRTHI